MLEREPLERLAADGQLAAFRHEGFWDCMDTYKDAVVLNDLWSSGDAPWPTFDQRASDFDQSPWWVNVRMRAHREGRAS